MFGYKTENFTDENIVIKFKKHLNKNEKFFHFVGNQQKGVFGGINTYLVALTKNKLLLMEVDMKTWNEKGVTPVPFSDIDSIKVSHDNMLSNSIPLPRIIIDPLVNRFFKSAMISKFIIKTRSGQKYKIQCSEGSTAYGVKIGGLEGQEKGVAKMNDFVDRFEEYKNGLSDSFFA